MCPSVLRSSGQHVLSGFLSTLAPPQPRQGCQLSFVIWLSPWGQTRAFPACLTFVSQLITLPGARSGLGTVASIQDKAERLHSAAGDLSYQPAPPDSRSSPSPRQRGSFEPLAPLRLHGQAETWLLAVAGLWGAWVTHCFSESLFLLWNCGRLCWPSEDKVRCGGGCWRENWC